MSNFSQVMKQCESASGTGSKEVIKTALASADAIARRLMREAMDPFRVFGVKKFDMPGYAVKSMDEQQDFDTFFSLLDRLASRELTGNAARDVITKTLGYFNSETQGYLARVIDKDLQCGFSAETYNKIHKSEPVRIFDVMLADKCSTEEEFEELNYPRISETKYDGERNICFVGDEIIYRSRSGKVAEHMAGLFDDDLRAIRDYLGYDFVLDGERMAKNYIDTINAKKSGKDGEQGKANMRFRAFFLMPLTDWMAQKTTITMAQNRAALTEILSNVSCKKIIISDAIIVNNHDEMMKDLDRVTSPGFNGMTNGQEGLILKDPNATYTWDRVAAWCKIKKFYDADARIINWVFGRKKNAKRMGRVNVAGWLEDGTYFEVGVGSGWTDKQRDDFVLNFEKNWLGKTVVVKYQEVSKAKGKEHASLRFPTVDQQKLLRDDKIVPLKD
jgi:DNA ligase-1